MEKLLKKMFFKINVFRILEINQRTEIIWRTFINEKWLNLGKNSKLCGILICCIPFPPILFNSTVSLKTNSLHSWQNKQPSSHRKGQKGARVPLKLILRELSLFNMSGRFYFEHSLYFISFWVHLVGKDFFSEHLSNTMRGNYLIFVAICSGAQ